MQTHLFPLAVSLAFRSSLPEQAVTDLNAIHFFVVTPERISLFVQDWIDKRTFEEELETIMSISKKYKCKMRGYIMCRIREGDVYGDIAYKISSKIKLKRCEFSISIKREKSEAAKVLTEEEKLAVFREYWNRKHTIPQKSEVYKDFKIGLYYSTADKSSLTMEALRGIMTESS